MIISGGISFCRRKRKYKVWLFYQDETLCMGWFEKQEEAQFLYDLMIALMKAIPELPRYENIPIERQRALIDYAYTLLKNVMPPQPPREISFDQ